MATGEDPLKEIRPEDVCELLQKKFGVERMHRFFTLEQNWDFPPPEFNLTPQNSMLLRFHGLEKAHPYNMLLVLGLADTATFSPSLQTQIRRVVENNIDKVVIWMKQPVEADVVRSLQRCNANVVYVSAEEVQQVNFISNFYPHGNDYNYAVVLNKLTGILVVRLKKLFHLVLSEIAAPSYDSDYGTQKIGTKAIMDFEEEILKKTIHHLSYLRRSEGQSLKIAVDVGCGTGRHSLGVLAPHFESIFGFDFSPKMVEVANKRKRQEELAKVVFTVADLEYEQIAYEKEFSGRSDLIVASFGMGSFIEDTAKMLRRFHEWLTPGGMLFLSMYNKNSVLLNLTPNWRDTSLSAHIDVDNNTLQVELSSETVFQIFCKPFDDTVKTEIAKKFDILNVYNYPTTLALLPNALLQDSLARDLFTYIDKSLAADKKFSLGHYILLVAQKQKDSDMNGHKNVMALLNQANIKAAIIEHDMVLSISDVLRVIGMEEGIFIKTLVFIHEDTKEFFVAVLSHEVKLNKPILAKHVGVRNRKLKFATEKQIVELGFSLGGIPPFGYPTDRAIRFFADSKLKALQNVSVFMGVGDNRKTLKLAAEDFIELIQAYDNLPLPAVQNQ